MLEPIQVAVTHDDPAVGLHPGVCLDAVVTARHAEPQIGGVSPATKHRLGGQRLRQTGRVRDEPSRGGNRPSDPIGLARGRIG